MKNLRKILFFMLLVSGILVFSLIFGADKKAEAKIRWGLDACRITLDEMSLAKNYNSNQLSSKLKDWKEKNQKFKTALADAEKIDKSIYQSTTMYPAKKKSYSDMIKLCQTMDNQIQEFENKISSDKKNYEDKKRKEEAENELSDKIDSAISEARTAISMYCSSFQESDSSYGLLETMDHYKTSKKNALKIYDAVVDEKLSLNFYTAKDQFKKEEKSIGEWFALCDKIMPVHYKKVVAQEKKNSDSQKEEDEKYKKFQDKMAKEAQEKYKNALASATGDKQKILKEKGFLPWFPQSNLNSATVWMYEIVISNKATTCEIYKFKGDQQINKRVEKSNCKNEFAK
ncbi:MAG TPA: hypothetical protein DHW82_02985 [Spirochaetia bacterium]|nr:MAG: hypothetical protein A2Y41_03610 [Spirochaetes bacterium GWB1_36_13]HCL55956.1 hypothetical protein [Spirochaetia bacterium]